MKKKLIQINTVCNGSTGNIMRQIQLVAEQEGYKTLSFYGRRKGYPDLPCEKIGSFFGFWSHVIWTTITDRQGLASYFSTKKMVKRLRKEKPDIIHMHNLHGYYLNYPILFKYLREEYKGKIVWTFHDCWPITGHCPYFTMKKCDKWIEECNHCPNKKNYPTSWFIDSSRRNYRLKKKMFSGMKNMVITTPSIWLKDIVEQSYLKDVKTVVIPNGIDLNVFNTKRSNGVIQKYKIPQNKKIILGVASVWEERKGLNTFVELSKKIGREYIIILVGLNQQQIKKIPSNIIGIKRTESKQELAVLYSQADVFLNPSQEETFSMVTIESMACGTPVIALDSSAVKELINDTNGIVLHEPTVEDYITAINNCELLKNKKDIIRDSVKKYSVDNMTQRMLDIYET